MKKYLLPLILICLVLSGQTLHGQYCEDATINLTSIVGNTNGPGQPLSSGTAYSYSSGILCSMGATNVPINSIAAFKPNQSTTLVFSNGQAILNLSWTVINLITFSPAQNVYAWQQTSTSNQTATIILNQKPTVTIAPIDSLCLNSSSITLSGGTPASGTYSGPGVSGSQFDPLQAGVGNKTIIYSYTASSTGCSNTASTAIRVLKLPVVSIGTMDPVCNNNNSVELTSGTPSGGNYSGLGVTNNKFDPTNLGTGVKTITYTYANPTGKQCSNFATGSITILNTNRPDQPTLTDTTKTVMCMGANQTLVLGNIGNNSVQWYSGTKLVGSASTLDINNLTEDLPLTIVYKDANKCVSDDKNLTIAVDKIKADFSTSKNTFKTGEEVFFTDKSIGAAKWAWKIGTAPFSSQNPSYFFYSADSIKITLIAISANSCSDTISKKIKVIASTATSNLANNSNVMVYPNPANEFIQIDLTGKNEDVILSIFKVTGEKVLEKQVFNANGIESIDSSQLPAGNYMLMITHEGISETQKLQID